MPVAYTAYAIHANHAGNADALGGQPAGNFAPTTHNHDSRYYPQQDSDSRFVNDNANEVDNLDIPNGSLSPNKVQGGAWTSANDGSGTGLDADLLDGQHGSGYAPSAHGHWGNTWTGSGTGPHPGRRNDGLRCNGHERARRVRQKFARQWPRRLQRQWQRRPGPQQRR